MRMDRVRKVVNLLDQLDCFGGFQLENPLCRKYCALSIRCAIEQDQNNRIELFEDIMSVEEQFSKIQ
jgi:hypothetical protein